MCTSPIQINRFDSVTHQTRTYVVPCGKCAECVSFKQKEFAALSIHQAIVSGSVYFFTLTYNDAHLPVAICDGGSLIGFDLPSCREIPISWFESDGKFLNMTYTHDGLDYTCSLRRADLQSWLRQFRNEYSRSHGVLPRFKYCFFGELGEVRGRPHYHGLLYGATPEIAHSLYELWCKRFGFAYCVPNDFRKLSFEEVVAVSRYVSKYISKGVSSRFKHLLDYIEKPRRICSRDFGEFSKDELDSLRKYYDCSDLKYLDYDQFFNEVLNRRTSLVIAGRKYPIPLRLKTKLFYEDVKCNSYSQSDDGRGFQSGEASSDGRASSVKAPLVPSKARRTTVSAMASKFARGKFDSNLSKQLRQSSEEDSVAVNRWIVRQNILSEKMSARSREEIAQKNNLNNLKSQKDGQ